MASIPRDTKEIKSTENVVEDVREKWQTKKLLSLAMSERMRKWAGLRKRAARMAECGDITVYKWCPSCGHTHMSSGNLCRDRLCPLCAWRLSLARYGQMMEVLDLLAGDMTREDIHVSMMTLTVRNCTIRDLHDTLADMNKAWASIRHAKYFSDSVWGWARSIEITYNAASRTYHPHMHILLFWKSNASNGKFNTAVVRTWKHSLGLNYNPIWHHEDAYVGSGVEEYRWREQRRDAADAAAREAGKYVVKSQLLQEIPDDHLKLFADAIAGFHMVSYGGAIKTARTGLGFTDDSFDEADCGNSCKFCGAEMRKSIMRWAGGTYVEIDITETEVSADA